MNYEAKPVDLFFDEYKSSYPYDKQNSIKMLKNIQNSSKIKLHELFLFWFPEHFLLNQKIFEILLTPSKGFIPITWKYYLGIMAASTMKCEFLFRYLEEEFLLNGGNEDWLVRGLEIVPEKLRKIDKINNIIAHQPWKLNEKDLLEIFSKTNQNLWNINEIVEAMLILINFYRLAAIIESIKLGLISPKSKLEEFEIFSGEEKLGNENANSLNFMEEDEKKNMLISFLENFNIYENENDNLDQIKFNENSPSKNNSSFEFIVSNEDFGKHISNYCTVYLDFDIHSQEAYSCLVKIFNKIFTVNIYFYFRNLTGKIKLFTSSKIFNLRQ
jgi:hypothetical protein